MKWADRLPLCSGLGKKAKLFFVVFLLFFAVSGVAEAKDAVQSKGAHSKTVAAIKAAKKDRWSEARQLVGETKDKLAAKIFLWLVLSDTKQDQWTKETFIRLSHFIRDNPSWPGISKMKVAAEGAMPESLSNAEVIGWYDDFSPKTGYGLSRYMNAMIIEGKRDQARKFLTGWWAETVVPREQQKEIYQNYHSYLSVEAHIRRLDLLLLNQVYDSARAIAGVLGAGYPQLAEARIALEKNAPNVSVLVNKVPKALQSDPGLLYERLRWRRKKDLDVEAIEILQRQPAAAKIQNLEDWWKERHIMIRRLIEDRNYKKAYSLAAKHGQKDGPAFAEAEWLAGWLALRFNQNPSVALKHFTTMYNSVTSPMSKTRGAYWAGRAAQAKGDKAQANEWFKKVSNLQTFYYGQLSAATLYAQSALPKDKLHKPSDAEKAGFSRHELVQAYHLFYEAGQKETAGRFLNAFLEEQDSAQAYYFAAEYAASRGDYYDAVKIAKDASRKGLFLTRQSYPAVTDWLKGIGTVEWALIHSLIRQESMFDPNAQSSAGALGLMQLMPGTAKETSAKLGIAYSREALTSRPSYNIQLGTSYIHRLLRKYEGCYPMAIAAYNAGPARVDEWIKTFGDPRKGEVDFLDWIELIPIYETRNYVQRVLEGVYVYRLRLKDVQSKPATPIHISYRIQP